MFPGKVKGAPGSAASQPREPRKCAPSTQALTSSLSLLKKNISTNSSLQFNDYYRVFLVTVQTTLERSMSGRSLARMPNRSKVLRDWDLASWKYHQK